MIRNNNYSLYLEQKYAQIFVLGHCLFIKACSFPQATHLEKCLLLRTDNVCQKLSGNMLVPNYMLNFMFYSDIPFCKSRFRSSSERTHKWRHVELGD